jgi:hypothetical protein
MATFSRSQKLQSLKVKVQGPFGFWCHSELPSVFETEAANCGGVYLWTIEHEGRYLTNYVGKAKSFGKRLHQHLSEFLSGGYYIYEAKSFITGRKKEIYHAKSFDRKTFIEDHANIQPELHAMLKAFRLFLIPVEPDSLAQRLEAALVELCKCEFLDNDNKGRRFYRGTSDEPVMVCLDCPVPIDNLSSVVKL